MKTTINFIPALLLAGMLISNTGIAQTEPETTFANVVSKTHKQPIITAEQKPVVPALSINKQNEMMRLDYKMPHYTYSAVLVIEDFTGRTLKTIRLNPYSSTNEFQLSGFLPGTYNYSLKLNDQEKESGEFVLEN